MSEYLGSFLLLGFLLVHCGEVRGAGHCAGLFDVARAESGERDFRVLPPTKWVVDPRGRVAPGTRTRYMISDPFNGLEPKIREAGIEPLGEEGYYATPDGNYILFFGKPSRKRRAKHHLYTWWIGGSADPMQEATRIAPREAEILYLSNRLVVFSDAMGSKVMISEVHKSEISLEHTVEGGYHRMAINQAENRAAILGRDGRIDILDLASRETVVSTAIRFNLEEVRRELEHGEEFDTLALSADGLELAIGTRVGRDQQARVFRIHLDVAENWNVSATSTPQRNQIRRIEFVGNVIEVDFVAPLDLRELRPAG